MQIVIQTERLTLRPLGIGDLETVHSYASDSRNTRYMERLPNRTREETAAFLRAAEAQWRLDKPEYYEFAVVHDNMQIGAVSVYLNPEGTEGELGWVLHRDYWMRGYATEAALAIKRFCREELYLQRLIAHCDERNTASRGVMRKLGMKMEWDTGSRFYPKTGEIAKECLYMCGFE